MLRHRKLTKLIQMLTFLKNNYKGIALVVVAVVITLLLTKSCNKPADHSAELKALQDSTTLYKTIIGQQSAQKDNLNKQLTVINKANDSLNNKVNAAKNDVVNKSKIILSLSQQVQGAKQQKDTAQYIANCDSLAAVAETEVAKTNYYIQLSDSLRDAHIKEMAIAHSLILNRDSAFTEANNMLFNTSRQLGIESKARESSDRKLMVEKKVRKGLLAVIVVAAVKIFVFK